MDTNTLWLRLFDHGGAALAFSTMTVVCGWFLIRRYIGHRLLLLNCVVFSFVQSTKYVYLMLTIFRASTSVHQISFLLTISTICSLALAVHIMISSSDILRTLTETEAGEMVRQDRSKDEQQKSKLFEWMAEQNRQNSVQFLVDVAARDSGPPA